MTSTNFDVETTPDAVPDFQLTNLIPRSYLAAGSMTFENNAGTQVHWRLSCGGGGIADFFELLDHWGPCF